MTPDRAWKPCTGTRGGKKGLFQTTHTTHHANFKPSEPDFLWRGHPLRTAGRGGAWGYPPSRAHAGPGTRARAQLSERAHAWRARMHTHTHTHAPEHTHAWRRARDREDARTVPLGARKGPVPVA